MVVIIRFVYCLILADYNTDNTVCYLEARIKSSIRLVSCNNDVEFPTV